MGQKRITVDMIRTYISCKSTMISEHSNDTISNFTEDFNVIINNFAYKRVKDFTENDIEDIELVQDALIQILGERPICMTPNLFKILKQPSDTTLLIAHGLFSKYSFGHFAGGEHYLKTVGRAVDLSVSLAKELFVGHRAEDKVDRTRPVSYKQMICMALIPDFCRLDLALLLMILGQSSCFRFSLEIEKRCESRNPQLMFSYSSTTGMDINVEFWRSFCIHACKLFSDEELVKSEPAVIINRGLSFIASLTLQDKDNMFSTPVRQLMIRQDLVAGLIHDNLTKTDVQILQSIDILISKRLEVHLHLHAQMPKLKIEKTLVPVPGVIRMKRAILQGRSRVLVVEDDHKYETPLSIIRKLHKLRHGFPSLRTNATTERRETLSRKAAKKEEKKQQAWKVLSKKRDLFGS